MKRTSTIIIILALVILCVVMITWCQNASSSNQKIINNKEKHQLASENFSTNALYAKVAEQPEQEIIQHTAYTISYNEKAEQPWWVAYLLTGEHVANKAAERSNKFMADDAVETGSATPADYKQSGYDRGHLAPAGDMAWSKETMRESFYMSNMSPQLPNFNRGIWKNLEELVRKWAIKNDSLWIISGPVIEKGAETIGREQVAIPNAFYKIIFDISLKDGRKAIAFYFPHKELHDSFENYATSINDVEKKTGIDFFEALPDSIEAIYESENNITNWK